MSKRGQTTGLPKDNAPRPPAKASPAGGTAANAKGKPSAKQEFRTHAEREAQLQRRLILGISIMAVAIIAILLIALVLDGFIRPNQVVATVEGENITVAQFQQRVRFERVMRIQQLTSIVTSYQNAGLDVNQLVSQEPFSTWLSDLRIPDQLGLTVVNNLVQDKLIEQAARELNVTVTQEDIDKAIQDYFGFDPAAIEAAGFTPTPSPTPTITPTPFVSPTPSPTPTITPTPEIEPTATSTPFPTVPPAPTLTGTEQAERFNTNRDSFYELLRRDAGMSRDDVLAYFHQIALRNKLRDAVTADITTTGLFVNTRHILVATEGAAQDIIEALRAGESFAQLARSLSTDTGSGASGGELGWSPVTDYVKPFADAVRDAEIGAIIGPVQTEFGYHVIQVRAREERELTEAQVNDARERAFQEWLTQRETDKKDQTQIFPVWSSFVPDDPPSPFR